VTWKIVRAFALAAVFTCAAAQAEGLTLGPWSLELDDPELVYALNMNEAGSGLAQTCLPKIDSCVWMLLMSTKCEEGSTYPILANSDAGARHLEVRCNGRFGTSELSMYAFADFKAVDAIVRSARRVGFAVPLQGDQFRVIRFGLEQADAALGALLLGAARHVPKDLPPRPAPDDELL
jgi:hypothetical protein